MTKSADAFVALTFAATVAATGWAGAQVRGGRTPPAGSSSQGRGGSPGGPGRGAPPPGSPTGARSSAGHTIIGQATPNPSVGHGYYPGYGHPGYPGYCCGYYGGYYPYYPWGFGVGFGWYGAYGWPYGYYGGYYPYYPGYGDASGSSEESHAPSHATGAIRLKVNVDSAKVFVDGGLVGKGGDFAGLTSGHLLLEGGSHVLEIKADGYETFTKTLTVETGKTMTERVTLNKKK